MKQALELLRLAKGTSLDERMLNSEEIKPVAIAIIELRLSERISKGVSRSVSRSVSQSVIQKKVQLNTEFLKLHNNFWNGLGMICRHF